MAVEILGPIAPLRAEARVSRAGRSVELMDWDGYLFINTDLTVMLHREPIGNWVCLDAATYPERSGLGLAESRLYDEKGPVGRGTETLFIAPRKR
ncbi:acyl-CoA thioesterase domain-containing protein [Nocardia wallacei]|uniref:acyl-CoA thioesterase domain-containing protein n=1 Tax=Nocardia wallacei TaxID=480035 RepID=UPI001E45E0A9|nr:acyl-CoA thioesterase domain-containing protein [Nocardia wallacei]